MGGAVILPSVVIGCQTWRVLPPDIWSLTAVEANCCTKDKLFIYVFDQRVPLIFHFSQLSGKFLAPAHLPPEYFVEHKSKQIKSTTAAYSNLRTFGAKHVMFSPNNCTLHVTDGIIIAIVIIIDVIITVIIVIVICCSVITSSLHRSRSCLSDAFLPPPPPFPFPT